jgi:hypothetical protein
MDVNGYMLMLKDAMKEEYPEETEVWRIKDISLNSLSNAFAKYESWKNLANPESSLGKFLLRVCYKDNKENMLSVQKLRIVGLLWCDGDAEEKVPELYETLQEEGDEEISWTDKDFRSTFN